MIISFQRIVKQATVHFSYSCLHLFLGLFSLAILHFLKGNTQMGEIKIELPGDVYC